MFTGRRGARWRLLSLHRTELRVLGEKCSTCPAGRGTGVAGLPARRFWRRPAGVPVRLPQPQPLASRYAHITAGWLMFWGAGGARLFRSCVASGIAGSRWTVAIGRFALVVYLATHSL